MPREKEDFRPILERILDVYGKDTLTMPEASEFTGRDKRTLLKIKDFPADRRGRRITVNAVRLARWLS